MIINIYTITWSNQIELAPLLDENLLYNIVQFPIKNSLHITILYNVYFKHIFYI